MVKKSKEMGERAFTCGGPDSGTRVVACEVFRDELEHLGVCPSNCVFLDQGLHRYPADLNKRLSETIDKLEKEHAPERIVLVYGYCGGGLERIATVKARLLVARVHDCIPLLMGGDPARLGPDGKGTFFLTRGWLKYGKTPYTEYFELKKKYGHEDALWSCKELLKMYDRVALIHTLPTSPPELIEASAAFARLFRMSHSQLSGDLGLLKTLLQGKAHPRVLCSAPSRRLSRHDFGDASLALQP